MGVVNSINALAPVIPTDQENRIALRVAAADFLASGTVADARSLTADAIDFIFAKGLAGLPRGRTIASRLIDELTPEGSSSAASLVRSVATIAPELDQQLLAVAGARLATLSDPEVSPVFDDLVRTYIHVSASTRSDLYRAP